MSKFKILLFLCLLCGGGALFGATGDPGNLLSEIAGTPASQAPPELVTELAVVAGLSILPFVVLLLTSFTKIVIVLSLLRNALGVQQSPPNQVINGIAIIMTIYVMYPTATLMYKEAQGLMASRPQSVLSPEGATFVAGVANKAKEPLRQFLIRNTQAKHVNTFYQLAQKSFGSDFKLELKPQDFVVLIPSYITSQLKGAFEVGVLIYMPFFVIDLVVSNILLAMGMMMLSPLTIALPLKLLLIVMVDGWTLIIQGLVMSYR
jgi:type III secretion protein R